MLWPSGSTRITPGAGRQFKCRHWSSSGHSGRLWRLHRSQRAALHQPRCACSRQAGPTGGRGGTTISKPSKETPPDYIKILHDEDEDGVAEKVTTFAEGFNNIQALAWKGDELWVANAPDLTVLRDTDGDLVADEYELIYTGLGHLRTVCMGSTGHQMDVFT